MSSIEIKKNINVIIYSYKGKLLKDVVKNTLNNSSSIHNISFQIFDQHPLNRKELFNDITDLQYMHIFWDHITSPCKYKSNSIKSSNFDYTLLISDSIMLTKNWDSVLVNYVGNKNIVVSGKGKTLIENKNIFYLNKKEIKSTGFEINNWIDRDFIFTQTSTLKNIEYPEYLKYNGEEEVLSMSYFCNGIDVYSADSSFYTKDLLNGIETTYHTFSEDHNYNEFINLLKNGFNKYITLTGLSKTVEEFSNFHQISRDYLKPLPFLKDDVFYDPQVNVFDKIDSKKFMTKVNYIA
jgi:hypothetical protein